MRKSEKIYQMALRMRRKKNKFAEKILIMILKVIFNFDIQTPADIDTSVQFVHNGMGCVIHPKTIIKANCFIYQNVTIGGNTKIIDGKKTNQGAPIIEEGCIIYSGACIAGPIIIGKNSIIGANVVVTQDIPDNSIVKNASIIIKQKKGL
ncbi:serine O-acetyltransferase [Enterococcus sp. AZ173]|jgi:serine O-acetyltransferase|uniref:serine O-acetyltransferase n=1 Tax=Enterococcus sp. AZ173 TaxID=2774700 RepID=UPI003D2D3FFF